MLPSWWRKNFLFWELTVAVLASVAFSVWQLFLQERSPLDSILSENRGPIYGTLASISGALVGFVIAAFAVVLSFSSHPRLVLLQESPHYMTMWRVFTHSILALALATILTMVALIIDREDDPVPLIEYAVLGSFVLAAIRLVRVLWILNVIVSVVTNATRQQPNHDLDTSRNEGREVSRQ